MRKPNGISGVPSFEVRSLQQRAKINPLALCVTELDSEFDFLLTCQSGIQAPFTITSPPQADGG
jgi:hypothetical protein